MTPTHPRVARVFPLVAAIDRPLRPARIEGLEDRRLFSVPSGFVQEVIATGIASPTAMTVAPDGRVFVSEKGGKLRVVKDGALLPTPFMSLSVDATGERGLLGVAFDPNFATNHFLYAYYTAKTPASHNRVSRFTANGNTVVAGSEKVLLDQPALTDATNHNGGALHFGSDGKLLIAVGDNAHSEFAQQLTSTFGKVLRINTDGSIPTDNPFYSQTTGVFRSIWATGLRNPFTFDVQPGTGKMYINDVGHNGDTAWEEVDPGVAGANYGWPGIQGTRTTEPAPAGYRDPVYTYQHGPGGVNGICIAGGAFYNPPASASNKFPAAYAGDYFFGDFGAGYIKVLNSDGTVSGFATGAAGIVDIDVATNGSLYYLVRTNGGPAAGLYRIRPAAGPSILADPVSKTVSVGQPATFTVQATGTGTLAYQWARDGADIAGATAASYTVASPQLDDNGASFTVRVTNAGGSAISSAAKLFVTTNAAPVPTINAPAAGSKFVAGRTVTFSGSATDAEDGALPDAALTWSVSYFTDGVERPYVNEFSGQAGGTFTPATQTPYLGTDVFFRIYLTATDSQGRSTTVTRDVAPTVSTIKLAANFAGLTVNLDGNPQVTPKTINSVVGLQRGLAAPATQVVGGVTYDFVSWSDGGAATHNITAPSSPTTYTATYKVRGSAGVKSLAATADSYVSQSAATTIYGSVATLGVRKSSSVYAQITYLTFDLSSLSTISSAILKLYGKQSVAGAAVNVTAYKVANTGWGESTINWNNRPTLGSALTSVSVNSTTAKWYQWDLMSYLKAEKAAGRNKVSIALSGTIATTPVAQFNSRQAAASKPVLEVK